MISKVSGEVVEILFSVPPLNNMLANAYQIVEYMNIW